MLRTKQYIVAKGPTSGEYEDRADESEAMWASTELASTTDESSFIAIIERGAIA
jgi:hypothetical protein